MSRAPIVCLLHCFMAAIVFAQTVTTPARAPKVDDAGQAGIIHQYGNLRYGNLPLSFEANYGQVDGRVKFLSRAAGYTLFLTKDEAVFVWSGRKGKSSDGMLLDRVSVKEANPGALRMRFHDANPGVRVTGLNEQACISNYFIGNDHRNGKAMSQPTPKSGTRKSIPALI